MPDQPVIDWLGISRRRGLDNQVGGIVQEGGRYVDWLARTEEERGQRAEDTIREGAERFDRPSMTDQDIRREFSGAGERASGEFLQNVGSLRDWLGGAGVIGGNRPAALLGNFQAQYQGALVDATRSLYEKRVQMDVLDRSQRWNARQVLADVQARQPSVAPVDWLGTAGGLTLGAGAVEAQKEQARATASANKSAGKSSGFGQILSAVISRV